MRIVLISKDNELCSLCDVVLTELFGSSVVFSVTEPGRAPVEADIYIWDFAPDAAYPPGPALERARNHFFVVHHRHLDELRRRIPCDHPNVILKPVTRATLLACLSPACSIRQAARTTAPGALNAALTDRDEVLQCLILANFKLQEYDRDRTNFLARAVHDFRAPLTAINGYCGLLIGEQLGQLTDEQKDVLRRMQHSAKRLSRMADGMFQLSAGRNVETAPKLLEGDLRQCTEQSLHEMAPFAAEKCISISVDFKPSSAPLRFERQQMEQVIVNLLDNAIKFTPKSGAVEICGYPYFWERRRVPVSRKSPDRRVQESHSSNSFRVDIRDSGSGIPDEHLEAIFEEYTSYPGGQDRSSGGLGLAICKFIINQHRGRIWAESSSKGAMFSFVLPFCTTEQQVAERETDSMRDIAGTAGT